jgi:hypothetical protein
MARMSARTAYLVFGILAACSWVLVAWDARFGHGLSAPAIATAVALTLNLVLWPLVTAFRVREGHVQKVMVCVECNAPQWEAERAIGFCLTCGSLRKPVPATY